MILVGSHPDHDDWRSELPPVAMIGASTMPFVVKARAKVRCKAPTFRMVENNKVQHWYGFNDSDEAVMFALTHG